MHNLDDIFSGQMTAAKWRALGEHLQAMELRSGPGVRMRQIGNKTIISAKRQRGGKGGSAGRFEFGGLVKKDNEWFVKMGVGGVIFNEITDFSIFADTADSEKARFCKAVFPTIEVDGDNVRIDDPSEPMLLLEGRQDVTVWLICDDQKCRSGKDKERLELTRKGKKPEAEKGEICVPLVDFDVETQGETKSAKNIYQFWKSDWQQPYLCDGNDSDGSAQSAPDSGSFPSDGFESDSFFDSQDSGSSEDESGEGDECKIEPRAYWVNLPTCLTRLNPNNRLDCRAKKMTVIVGVKFFRNMNPQFGEKDCTGYAFGVELIGGKKPGAPSGGSNEYVWTNDWQRDLTFELDTPHPCQVYEIKWRVKSFGPPSGPFDDPEDAFACCSKEWPSTGNPGTVPVRGGSTTAPIKPLPKSCGCSSC